MAGITVGLAVEKFVAGLLVGRHRVFAVMKESNFDENALIRGERS